MEPGRENFLVYFSTLDHVVRLLCQKDYERDKNCRVAIAKGLTRYEKDPLYVFCMARLLHDDSALVRRIAKDVLNGRITV
jgi:hypothetical protein